MTTPPSTLTTDGLPCSMGGAGDRCGHADVHRVGNAQIFRVVHTCGDDSPLSVDAQAPNAEAINLTADQAEALIKDLMVVIGIGRAYESVGRGKF